MNRIDRTEIPKSDTYEGTYQPAFGHNAAVEEAEANMGFVTVTFQSQPLHPHRHETEIMYIEEAKDAFLYFGKSPDAQMEKIPLEAGDIFCAAGDDWHKIAIESETGFAKYVTFMANGSPDVHIHE